MNHRKKHIVQQYIYLSDLFYIMSSLVGFFKVALRFFMFFNGSMMPNHHHQLLN